MNTPPPLTPIRAMTYSVSVVIALALLILTIWISVLHRHDNLMEMEGQQSEAINRLEEWAGTTQPSELDE